MKQEDIISERHLDPEQAEAIRREKAEAGSLVAVIDLERQTITAGPYVMRFDRIAIPVKTLRRRVDAAIRHANTEGAGMVLEPKHYQGRAKALAEQIDAIAVQCDATLAEVAGRDVTDEKDARAGWEEYCRDAGSTLAQFGMTRLVI